MRFLKNHPVTSPPTIQKDVHDPGAYDPLLRLASIKPFLESHWQVWVFWTLADCSPYLVPGNKHCTFLHHCLVTTDGSAVPQASRPKLGWTTNTTYQSSIRRLKRRRKMDEGAMAWGAAGWWVLWVFFLPPTIASDIWKHQGWNLNNQSTLILICFPLESRKKGLKSQKLCSLINIWGPSMMSGLL